MTDSINPRHYKAHKSGVECIELTEHMTFNLGNAIKYIFRRELKNDAIEDMKKAVWYFKRESARIGDTSYSLPDHLVQNMHKVCQAEEQYSVLWFALTPLMFYHEGQLQGNVSSTGLRVCAASVEREIAKLESTQ